MQRDKTKFKKQRTFYSILGLISDVVLFPIIIIALLSSFVMFVNQRENDVKSIFGVSIVCIRSGSMQAAGFNIRDTVILYKSSTDDLRPKSEDYEGDIIAFYYYQDSRDAQSDVRNSLTSITDFDNIKEPTVEEYEGRRDVSEVAKLENVKVYFHRIIDVMIDDSGTRFFITQGDSNESQDAIAIREDYVVGTYVYTPTWLRAIFRFCASSVGMIILVVLPLTALIMMQMLSLLEQISALMTEKKVLAGTIRFDSEEAIKANVGVEMRDYDKVYFYDVVPVEDKLGAFEALWGYLKYPNVPKRKKKALITALRAKGIYAISRDRYYEYWNDFFRLKASKDKLKRLKIQARFVKTGKSYEDAVKAAKTLFKEEKDALRDRDKTRY